MTVRGQKRERREAEDKRSRQRLPVREIIATAARAGWRDRWRVLIVSVVISTAAALLEVVAADVIDRTNVPLSVISDLSSSGLSVLGTVFLSGFLCRLVGHAKHGAKPPSIWQIARGLPWRRLILADLLVGLLVLIGVIALIVPGLIVLSLFAVVAPVIEIEDRRVFAALRRSARLVRPHFWWVLLLAALPLFLLTALETGVPDGENPAAILEALAIRGVGDALIEAAIGLILVTLCYRLIDADAGAASLKAEALKKV
jgi:hypothetical protein